MFHNFPNEEHFGCSFVVMKLSCGYEKKVAMNIYTDFSMNKFFHVTELNAQGVQLLNDKVSICSI